MTEYSLDNAWDQASRRLALLENQLDPISHRRLRTTGLGAGWRCLEVGGGGGSITKWLCEQAGAEVTIMNVTDLDLGAIAAADLLFVGTWTDGIIIAGHRPGRVGRFWDFPIVDGKKTALFMTYAIHAGKVLDKFAGVMTERGADVVAAQLFKRNKLGAGLRDFVTDASKATVVSA